MIKYTMTVGEASTSYELESMEQLFAVMDYNDKKVSAATTEGDRPPEPRMANHLFGFSPLRGKWYSCMIRNYIVCWFEWNDGMGTGITDDNLPDDLIK